MSQRPSSLGSLTKLLTSSVNKLKFNYFKLRKQSNARFMSWPTVKAWGALLAACRNTGLAEVSGRALLEIGPENAGRTSIQAWVCMTRQSGWEGTWSSEAWKRLPASSWMIYTPQAKVLSSVVTSSKFFHCLIVCTSQAWSYFFFLQFCYLSKHEYELTNWFTAVIFFFWKRRHTFEKCHHRFATRFI